MKQPWQMTPEEFLRQSYLLPQKKPKLSLYDWLLVSGREMPQTATAMYRAEQEYNAEVESGRIPIVEVGRWMLSRERPEDRMLMLREHRRLVADAINAGEPVPARVLAFYPSMTRNEKQSYGASAA